MYNAGVWADRSWGQWTGDRLAAGDNNNGYVYRTLLRFDLTSLGSNIEVTSATLTLTHANTGKLTSSTSLPVQLYLLADANAAWIEGTGNANAVNGDPCWNYLAYDSTSPIDWTGGAGIGADASSAGIDSLIDTVTIPDPTAVAVGDTLTFNLSSSALDTLESWAAGGMNAGFFIKTDETVTANAIQVASREHDTATYRPTLEVQYAVPEPSCMLTLGMLSAATLFLRRRRSFSCNDT
jgi:hypothetical protein